MLNVIHSNNILLHLQVCGWYWQIVKSHYQIFQNNTGICQSSSISSATMEISIAPGGALALQAYLMINEIYSPSQVKPASAYVSVSS
jgi:hypothetical protein